MTLEVIVIFERVIKWEEGETMEQAREVRREREKEREREK